MKKFISLSIFLITLTCKLHAQDIHFSQAAFAPMALNPALTGIHGAIRANLNYRSQWTSVASPFKTAAASFDARISKSVTKNFLALGIFFMNDKAGNPSVSQNLVQLSLAYHTRLNRNSRLSMGLYGGYGTKRMGDVSGKWASQYDGISYNDSQSSGESFNNLSFSYPDAGAGIVYQYSASGGYITQNKSRRFTLGISAFHVNRPNASFAEEKAQKLPIRFSAFANAEIGILNSAGVWMPGIYYQHQGAAGELLFGTYYKYILNSGSKYTSYEKPFSMAMGFFARTRDAFVVKGLVNRGDYTMGISYDINTSSLSTASGNRGGYELFLCYTRSK